MAVSPLQDVWQGLRQREFWTTFAWNDVKARYRRSRIGQFWITISVGLFVLGVGLVYSGIFGIPMAEYMPRVAVAYVVWTFISTVIIGGCRTFIDASAIMQQRVFPFSVHAYRLVARELLILMHNALVVVAVWLAFGIGLGPEALWVIPGLFLLAYVSFWLCMIFGIVSARYRDVPPIVQSLVSVLFFVTPVLWTGDRLGDNSELILHLNPFAYLIAIIRDPLLGRPFDPATWLVVLMIAAVVTALGLLAMRMTSKKLAYWL
ncbi:ABC transporter permease [Devosia sp. 1566]|uniref:ABC transporter permease n=1 Tax=Devosia sp. 1566 TaxID=2499144 RepID=UPI000FD8CCEF|nr:ABC transporter permease [Devosia sp. 1566]